jgi:hypothetical protein
VEDRTISSTDFRLVIEKYIFKRLPGVMGSKPGSSHFIYFLIFTTLPVSHSGSPGYCNILKILREGQDLPVLEQGFV